MKSYQEAFDHLKSLGVEKWDTLPPTEGKIKWFDADKKKLIAKGDFKVILSTGPGDMYTMAYDIGVYKDIGIPFVEKVEDEPAIVKNISDEKIIRQRAEKVAEIIGADFIYQCGNLLVGVFGFEEV